MMWQNFSDDYGAIAAVCEQIDADLLLIDDQLVEYESVRAIRTAFLRELRERHPSLQVVGVYLDPWSIDDATLRDAANSVDLVWCMSPAQHIWQDPVLAAKCLFSPFPYAADESPAWRQLVPRLRFSGGVLGYNWHRAFWLPIAQHAGLHIDTRLAGHTNDGLPAGESTQRYMHDLAEATCSLNFSMRPDLSRIATGRCFETCLVGSLLVQEYTPDLDYYLISGEHYLEFTNLDELLKISRLLETRPDEAEEVRRRGSEFARRHYHNDAIISSLETALARLQAE